MRSRILVLVLLLAALAQGALLWRRLSARPAPRPTPVRFLAEGDTLPLRLGVSDPSAAEPWTVVLAFRTSCAPSRRAAPVWASWLRQERPARVVAVTRDSLATAIAYATREGWGIPVRSVLGAAPGTGEHAVVARTPWVFLIDPAGVIRYQGTGDAALPTVDSLLASVPDADAHVRSPLRAAAARGTLSPLSGGVP